MTLDQIVAWVGGSGIVSTIAYFLGLKKQKIESKKLELEAESISLDTDIKLIKFYEAQVIALTEKYEGLCLKLEERIKQYDDCVKKVEELEEKYNDALAELNKLKNEAT